MIKHSHIRLGLKGRDIGMYYASQKKTVKPRAKRKVRTKRQRRAAIRDGYRFGLPRPTKEGYVEYLKGKWWQRRRREKLKSIDYACEKCKISNVILHVHHLHYCSLGQEKNIDLQVLCEPCHKAEHPGWK